MANNRSNDVLRLLAQCSRFRIKLLSTELAFALCFLVIGLLSIAHSQEESAPPLTTLGVESFQTDLFTGSATAEIPILTPLAAAGITPKIVLRYNSATVDQLGLRQQGQGTGLGWTLDVGGFILRDLKNTTSTSNDTFKLVFEGVAYDLVKVDATQNIYHTKDETFWKLQYTSTGDFWTLTTKDGTVHRFGFNTDSKGITLAKDLITKVTYKYLLDEVKTTSGTAVRYSYFKQTGTYSNRTYDQAVYPDLITYAYNNGVLVGPAREVRFIRGSRSDWTQGKPLSFHELSRLDAIEVRVGGSLARKYVLGFDHSIDRDSTHTWGGGATGNLTLKSLTMLGSDGISSLPQLTFTYKGPTETGAARLASTNNGFGGKVSFAYQNVASNVLVYLQSGTWVYRNPNVGPFVGSILSQSITGGVPVFCHSRRAY